MAILQTNIAKTLSENGGLLDPSLLKPEVWNEVVDIYGEQSLTGIMDYFGRSVPTNQTTFNWEEDGFIHSVVTTGGGTAGGAGQSVVLTITTGTTNYRNSGKDSWPAVGEEFYLAKQGITGFIIAKNTSVDNAHTITLAPSDPAVTLSVASGEEITIVGHEQEEGGDIGPSKMHVTTPKSGNTVIHTANFETTGSAVTLNKIADYINVDGKRTKVEVLKQVNDLYKRFNNEFWLKMLIDKPVTNSVVTNALGKVKGMTGLLPNIETNGTLVNYTAGSMSLTDIDTVVDAIIANRGPKEVWQVESSKFAREYDDVVKGLFDNGGIIYGSFNGQKDIAISLGFRSFTRGNVTFHRTSMDFFNHSQTLGAKDSRFNNYSFIIPQSTVRDASTGRDTPCLTIRYKANEIADRKEQFLITGGAPGIQRYTSTADKINYAYRGERGLQAMKINQFVAMKG